MTKTVKRKPGQFAAKWDPTHTSSIVNAWTREVKERLGRVKKEIAEAVAKEDDYGLAPLKIHARRQYAFQRSAEKLTTFRTWVEYRLKYHLMDMQEGPTMMTHEGQWWANKYVQSAYKKGMTRAAAEMKKRGFKQYQQLMPVDLKQTPDQWAATAFTAPVHMDRVALIYSRTYEDLKGVAEHAAKAITDKLADGMIGGEDPYTVAKEMAAAADVSLARARMIARTETIRAHHVASINTYREAGLEGVEIMAELATVGRGSQNHDALHVCEECQALERRTKEEPITLEEAEGLIPVHPNCRCVAIPRVMSVDYSGEPEGEINVPDEESESE
jgi:hypothetical protein